jgi:hypothetical protein
MEPATPSIVATLASLCRTLAREAVQAGESNAALALIRRAEELEDVAASADRP